MRGGVGALILFGFVIAIFAIAAIFIPVIFGSTEASINLTNNTTLATYNATTTMVVTANWLFWIGAVLCALFMVVAILIWRK